MKTFNYKMQTWTLSNCGEFVRYLDSGWYKLDMFNAEFQQAAKGAK